jgi:protein-L-isoaspartate(D-aspartate) O-methyltransferase
MAGSRKNAKCAPQGPSAAKTKDWAMIDSALRRDTMVDTQLRPNEVTDGRLLEAMRSVPRELFVRPPFRGLAYMDESIEVFGSIDGAVPRYLLAPMVLARLIQLASVEPEDTVLDVGCATGYSTAVLARLACSVTALEPEPELAKTARRVLRELGVDNAEILKAALNEAPKRHGPFDVILLNGSVPEPPEALLDQLKEGGRLVCVIAPNNAVQGKAYLFVRIETEASGVPHFDAGARPLPGFAPEPRFSF